MKYSLLLAPVLALASLFQPTAAQNAIHVVDATGAGDFLDLPQAIAAAANGDVLLVNPGTYSSIQISGKALEIVGQAAGVEVQGRLLVEQLSSAQTVVIRGLTVTDDIATVSSELLDNDGEVWIEDCVLEGGDGPITPTSYHLAGLLAQNCASVVVMRSTLRGGGSNANRAAEGLLVRGSAVAVYDSELRGGAAFRRHGGHGAQVEDLGETGSHLFASETLFKGANGAAGNKLILPSGLLCGDGYKGGDGARINGFLSSLDWLECTFTEGNGGPTAPGCASQAQPGTPGIPLNVLVGVANELVNCVAHSVAASSPVLGGTNMDLVVSGAPGATYLIGFSIDPTHVYSPSICSVLHMSTFTAFVSGVIPGSGTDTVSFTTTAVPQGLAHTLYLQGVYTSPNGLIYGAPSTVTVFNP